MTVVDSLAILELSESAYAEIECKLLAAGYDHLFVRGPGSRIRMDGFVVERAADADADRQGTASARA